MSAQKIQIAQRRGYSVVSLYAKVEISQVRRPSEWELRTLIEGS